MKKISPFGVFLIDRSESMGRANLGEIESPITLKRFKFGYERNGTAIGEGLLDALDRYEEASFFILYSDGANTYGKNPIEAAAEIGIPVYIIFPNLVHDTSGYISIFGPEIIEEGDTAIYSVHYCVSHPSIISVLNREVLDKKEIEGEGVLEFALNPAEGKHTFEFNLSIGNRNVGRSFRTLLVEERTKVLVYTGKLDWNYKFFYRYFEEIGYDVVGEWKKDIPLSSLIDYDIVCLINPEGRTEEKLGGYIKNGGNAIILNSSLISSDFLPLIAPKVITFSNELPIRHYLKPGGIRRGSRSIDIMGETMVYILEYGKGAVAQFACLDPWRLSSVGKGVYKRDLFGEVMGKLLRILRPANLNISYPDRLMEGEELNIIFEQVIPDSFIWDGHSRPLLEDCIIIPSPVEGIHNFRVVFPSSTLIGFLEVIGEDKDRMGVDTSMLDAIANVSGGGKWKDDFDQFLFGYKEKEFYINLRHNWFFLAVIFMVLFFDWYLWMKGK